MSLIYICIILTIQRKERLTPKKIKLIEYNQTNKNVLEPVKSLIGISNINIADNRGFTPLHYLSAISHGVYFIVVSCGLPFSFACHHVQDIMNMMNLVVDKGAQINAQDYMGNTVFNIVF